MLKNITVWRLQGSKWNRWICGRELVLSQQARRVKPAFWTACNIWKCLGLFYVSRIDLEGSRCLLCSIRGESVHSSVFLSFPRGRVLQFLRHCASNRAIVHPPHDRWINSQHLWNDDCHKTTEIFREKITQCRFVHHKSHTKHLLSRRKAEN